MKEVALHCVAPMFIVLAAVAPAHGGVASGVGTVTLVDGQAVKCEVLFQHPNAPLLIVRSSDRATLQSFPLGLVHQVAAGGATEVISAKRALTPEETATLRINRLWVHEAGPENIGKYATETWEPKPAMIWAHPGQSGDAWQADQWLDEKGRPHTEVPWVPIAEAAAKGIAIERGGRSKVSGSIFDGDMLLPAADQRYEVALAKTNKSTGRNAVRHLTIEANAALFFNCMFRGNVWVKQGSIFGFGNKIDQSGLGGDSTNKHTIARFCADPATLNENSWVTTRGFSHQVAVHAGTTGSTEVIGLSGGANDRLSIDSGTLIISPDSYLGNGGRSSFSTQPGTTLIMLDGAKLACPAPLMVNYRATYAITGTVQFGTKEHPLTRGVVFDAMYTIPERIKEVVGLGERAHGGSIILGPTGRMEIHSSDPANVRVTFRPRDRANSPKADWANEPAKGMAAVFLGETDFDGVVFDGFYPGGIIVAKEAVAKWRHVAFGPNNLAPPAQLFKPELDEATLKAITAGAAPVEATAAAKASK